MLFECHNNFHTIKSILNSKAEMGFSLLLQHFHTIKSILNLTRLFIDTIVLVISILLSLF